MGAGGRQSRGLQRRRCRTASACTGTWAQSREPAAQRLRLARRGRRRAGGSQVVPGGRGRPRDSFLAARRDKNGRRQSARGYQARRRHGRTRSTRIRPAGRADAMELRELGSTGVMVPAIGTGVWRYNGGVEPLRRGVEAGAFLIDTAEAYGTEDVVGAAVKGIRDKVFIATKVSGDHLAYDDVIR